MTKSELFERIINDGIATESEINLVTDIAGYSVEILNQIILLELAIEISNSMKNLK